MGKNLNPKKKLGISKRNSAPRVLGVKKEKNLTKVKTGGLVAP